MALLDDWKKLNALINVAEEKEVEEKEIVELRRALNRLYEAATKLYNQKKEAT